jgi:hypothetical protein
MPFIETPDSWLFHLTRIYLSKYIIKNSKKKSQFISSYDDATNNSHNNMNIAFTIEGCAYLYYYKI